MLKKILPVALVAAAVLAITAVAPLVAQQQPAVRIGVVDNDRVFEESQPGQSAQQQIEDAYSQWQTRVQQAEQELQQFQNQATTATGVQAQDLQARIEEKQVEIQRLRSDANRELGRVRDQVLAELEAELTPAVEALAQEEGYTVVLNTQSPGLLYYDSAIDITDALITRLNAGAAGPGEGQGS